MRYTERFDVITAVDKDGNETHRTGVEIEDKTNGYEKLAQLEDIEEEIGVDLITLFEVFKNGIRLKERNFIQYHKPYDGGIVEGLSYFRRIVEPEWVQKYKKNVVFNVRRSQREFNRRISHL